MKVDRLVAREIAEPVGEPAPAPLRLRSAQPSPHIRALARAQMTGERAVGRVKEMMRLVENEARAGLAPACAFLARRAHVARGLRHDERVIGDDEIGGARAPDIPLDEADAIMRAGRVDALAAPVGKVERLRLRRDPGWQIAADEIAVARRAEPARDETENGGLAPEAKTRARRRFLKIEDAEIILASLAHDRLLAAYAGIGIEPREFLIDLALQIFRIGRNPHRAVIRFRPEARGRDVPRRLAGAGARFREHDLRMTLRIARIERAHGERGIFRLRAAFLAPASKHRRQARDGVFGKDGCGARLPARRWFLPFGKMRPCGETRLGFGGVERAQDCFGPRPSRARHDERNGGGSRTLFRGFARQLREKPRADLAHRDRRILKRLRLGEAKRACKTQSRRQRQRARPHECEEIEQIEMHLRDARIGALQRARCAECVDDEMRLLIETPRGFVRRQRFDVAVAAHADRVVVPDGERGNRGDGKRQHGATIAMRRACAMSCGLRRLFPVRDKARSMPRARARLLR